MADILSQDELDALLASVEESDDLDEDLAEPEPEAAPQMASGGGGGDILSQGELDALLGGGFDGLSFEEEPAEEPAPTPEAAPEPPPPSVPALASEPEDTRNIDLLLSIPVRVAVELGRTRLTISELMQVGQGSILELNRVANELLDLTTHGKVIATGEVVVVNENFGFRALEVDSVRERLQKL